MSKELKDKVMRIISNINGISDLPRAFSRLEALDWDEFNLPDKKGMFQCPFEKACRCTMTESCTGCETQAKSILCSEKQGG